MAKTATIRGWSGSLQAPPLVIRQSRQNSVFWVLVGTGVLWLGLSGNIGNDLIDGLMPESAAVIYVGTLLLVVALIACARPARITFTPAGLRYRLFFSSRIVRWGEIAAVHARKTTKGKPNGVAITLSSGRPIRLSGKWPMNGDDLDRLIRQARREWGR